MIEPTLTVHCGSEVMHIVMYGSSLSIGTRPSLVPLHPLNSLAFKGGVRPTDRDMSTAPHGVSYSTITAAVVKQFT